MAIRLTSPPDTLSGNGTVASGEDIDELIEEIINPPDPVAEAAVERARQLQNLAGQIRSEFQQAYEERMRTGVTARLHNCIRLKKGEYTAEYLALIRQFGGSEHYFNLIARKAESAAAWIKDTLTPEIYEPDMEPTPMADLPDSDKLALDAAMQAALAEPQPDGTVLATEAIEAARQDAMRQLLIDLQAKAALAAKGMTQKIRDQYHEGGFNRAFTEVIDYITTTLSAFLKGPEIRVQKRTVWRDGVIAIESEPVPTWRAVCPLDMYPGPNIATMNEGYVCETVNYGVDELRAMKGQPGWNDAEIDAALADERPTNEKSYLPQEIDRAAEENRSTAVNEGLATGMVCAVEWWGLAGKDTPFPRDTQLRAILIGEHVVHAIKNPDPLGRRPYFCSSFKKVPGSVWGTALAEKGEAVQEAANACARNLVDNLAMSSGPLVGIDTYSYEGPIPTFVIPRSLFTFDSSKIIRSGVDPIRFFQPPSNAEVLTRCYQFFADMMDDVTGIVRYIQGDGSVPGGAGQTASGLSMLMTAQRKVLRDIINNIEVDILRPALEMTYTWDIVYLGPEFAEIKGDCRVKPIGPLGIMSREITDMRIKEFLMFVDQSPNAMAIIGPERFAEGLRAYAERLRLPSEMIPTQEEIRVRFANGMGQSGGMEQPGQPPTESTTTLPPPMQPAPSGDLFGGNEPNAKKTRPYPDRSPGMAGVPASGR